MNDGPTRRLLYRKDILSLNAKEQEYEADPEELKTDWGYQFESLEELKAYRDDLRRYYKMSQEERKIYRDLQIRVIQDGIMLKLEKEKEEQIRKAERLLRENNKLNLPKDDDSE